MDAGKNPEVPGVGREDEGDVSTSVGRREERIEETLSAQIERFHPLQEQGHRVVPAPPAPTQTTEPPKSTCSRLRRCGTVEAVSGTTNCSWEPE